MSTSSTHVFRLSPERGSQLREELNQGDFEFRRVDHAHFQARGDGAVATLYQSGKLVLQGVGADSFMVRFLGDIEPVPPKQKTSVPETPKELPLEAIGSDEAGKGDSFGGISVFAVFVREDQIPLLLEAGVMDSKKISDNKIRILSPWIQETFPYAERTLSAEEYNEEWESADRNVNRLLTKLHSQVLNEVRTKTGAKALVVDRFGANHPVSAFFKPEAKEGVQVFEVPRAEAHPSVAAASVLARAAFIASIKELSEVCGADLPLGSGSPVPPALRTVLKIHGKQELKKFAKLHFKNVQKSLS
ncbi:MAG: ribonuclease HIII [Planctomycetes bacterium]|jgi:ribonuclease HIII|nr:ribonuclease HIII [Planctomycetota bacterium]MDP6129282.1 ribonuclease HIII [Planctomycetota bacterium]MDP7245054.1 ribonuclease HIII [Planctomycetota bacterium]|tara:strand:+ start:2749 stop:3657 length:909 start_codon:yes stop_codon:yes gene_type:complete